MSERKTPAHVGSDPALCAGCLHDHTEPPSTLGRRVAAAFGYLVMGLISTGIALVAILALVWLIVAIWRQL